MFVFTYFDQIKRLLCEFNHYNNCRHLAFPNIMNKIRQFHHYKGKRERLHHLSLLKRRTFSNQICNHQLKAGFICTFIDIIFPTSTSIVVHLHQFMKSFFLFL